MDVKKKNIKRVPVPYGTVPKSDRDNKKRVIKKIYKNSTGTVRYLGRMELTKNTKSTGILRYGTYV